MQTKNLYQTLLKDFKTCNVTAKISMKPLTEDGQDSGKKVRRSPVTALHKTSTAKQRKL